MDKKDYSLITLSIITLASLGFGLMPEPNYYCDSRELNAYCFDVSETGKSCYTLPDYKGQKICSEGWKEYKELVPQGVSGAKAYLCNTNGCKVK